MRKTNQPTVTAMMKVSAAFFIALLTATSTGAKATFWAESKSGDIPIGAWEADYTAGPGSRTVTLPMFDPMDPLAQIGSDSRAIRVEIPSSGNRTDMWNAFSIDWNLTSETTCGTTSHPNLPVFDDTDIDGDGDYSEIIGSTPFVCSNPDASFSSGGWGGDPGVYAMALACPSGGLVYDSQPSVDDDSDPSTPERMDGPGPHSCSTGDWSVLRDPAGVGWYYGYQIYAETTGADRVTTADTPLGQETFLDNQAVEMIVCFGPSGGSGLDFAGLSASFDITYSGQQRAGIVRDQPKFVEAMSSPTAWRASSCADALWRSPLGFPHPRATDPPPDPDPDPPPEQ